MDTWSLPPEQRAWASSGRLSRSALSSTAPTRPTTPLSRQSRRIPRRMRLPSSGAMPHACMAATSAPADAPATGVSGVMNPRSRRPCHAPTWYGKIMPAAENPTPPTRWRFRRSVTYPSGGARVTRTARRSTTPRACAGRASVHVMRPLLVRWAPARLSCSGSVHPTTAPSALRKMARAVLHGLSFFRRTTEGLFSTRPGHPTGYGRTVRWRSCTGGGVMRAMFAGGIGSGPRLRR